MKRMSRCPKHAMWKCFAYIASHEGQGVGCIKGDDAAEPCLVRRGAATYPEILGEIAAAGLEIPREEFDAMPTVGNA